MLITDIQEIAAFQEAHRGMQDRPVPILSPLLVALIAIGISGCAKGDYGRHQPSLVTKAYTKGYDMAREFLGEEEDYDLPLTASEDALRTRAADMATIGVAGVLGELVPGINGDGYAQIGALTENIKVDHQRFMSFVEAAKNVIKIDELREERLQGLDALTSRRQHSLVVRRRGRNNRLIRNGVRIIRERSEEYRETLMGLPVAWPDVPLDELQTAYEAFHSDVVMFHAEIDQLAHMKLGKGDKKRSK